MRSFGSRNRRRKPASPGPSRDCAALLRWLRSQGFEIPGPDNHWTIQRTRAGRHQRSAGAWSWHLWWRDPANPLASIPSEAQPFTDIGSQWPLRECLRPGATIFTDRFGHHAIIPQETRA